MIPPWNDPISMANIDDVFSFALGIRDLPIRFEVLALLDERRQVVKLIVDFTDQQSGYPTSWALGEIVETPHFSCVYFMLQHEEIEPEEPAIGDRVRWEGMHEMWRILSKRTMHPVELLDVIFCAPESFRSLAYAFEDEPVWSNFFDDVTNKYSGYDDAA